MTTKTITHDVTLAIDTCCVCGVTFAIPKRMQDKLRENGNDFYCPNGHTLHYPGKTSKQKIAELEAKLAREKESNQWYIEQGHRDRKTIKDTKNKLRGQKAANTRLKNRVSKGICPCCNRQFVNLRRHMETKHPNYKGDE